MKTIALLLVAFALGFALNLFISETKAAWVQAVPQWSEWWSVKDSYGGEVKRIYDHENKLVCWLYKNYYGSGISCVPSLELEHPGT